MTAELSKRITEYLAMGGLFNPEFGHPDAVRDLLIECRAALDTQAPAEGDGMLEPLVYAAMMHSGTPKTVAEFERAAANVADMLQRRAEVTHNKPVASIYISDDGSREFDDWRVDLPPGNHQLFTAPRPDQPQPESLPHPGAPEAEEMIEQVLAEYNRPCNMKNAARAGYMAAKRLLQNARQPLPAVEDAEPIGWGGVIETCAELCDPHFIAQQDLDELKSYAGNWNSTYRFFPIYAPAAKPNVQPKHTAEPVGEVFSISAMRPDEDAYATVRLLHRATDQWVLKVRAGDKLYAQAPAPGAESEEALLAAMHKLEDVYFKRGLPAFETAAEHVQHAAELIALGTQSDETAWLLETNGGGHALYWDGGLWIGESPRISGVMQFGLTTTKDAGKAVRFVSRELAEAALKSFRTDYRVAIGGAGVWKAAEHMWPASQAPAVGAEEERDRLRAAQAAAVMPLIGPLLDAWENADHDALEDQAELVKQMEAINFAMEHAGDESDVPVQGTEGA